MGAGADATSRLVRVLDRQLGSIADEVNDATANMGRAESELAQKKVVLRRRLVDIYKRGPLYTAEALLSAASFGELVARYKYLHLLALRDRALVRRVEQLRNQVALERDRLVVLQRGLQDNLEDKRRKSTFDLQVEEAEVSRTDLEHPLGDLNPASQLPPLRKRPVQVRLELRDVLGR